MNQYSSNNIAEKTFGFMPDGTEVKTYTLTNSKGTELNIINYGATITSLKILGKNKILYDVVLGFDNIEAYIDSYNLPSVPYIGAVMGRYSGRIKNGCFSLNGKNYQLNKNLGMHHLHGGNKGFGQAIWEAVEMNSGKNPFLRLTYTSPEGEENFPGEMITDVIYTLTENNELQIEYKAQSSKDTIINLTQHSYFNLDGSNSNVKNQLLQVNSDIIIETDNLYIPTGNLIEAKNKNLDFTTEAACPVSIDTSFVIKDNNKPSAVLKSKKSGLKMTVFTNQPSVHIYVGGNCFGKIKGKYNTDYHHLSGICFETQNFPDAPNNTNFPSALLKKGYSYYQKSVYRFEINND